MGFIYLLRRRLLENICREWHFTALIPAWPRAFRSTIDVPQSGLAECANGYCNQIRAQQEHSMVDVLMIALTFGAFALAIGYAYACERL
jgi:hypothetical protein